MLVVVGNVTRADVEQLVLRTIAKLPEGSYRWTLPDTLPSRGAGLTIELVFHDRVFAATRRTFSDTA